MTTYMFNVPRYRTQKKCLCYNSYKNTTINTVHNRNHNRATTFLQIADATKSGAIKGKTTFIKYNIDPQFGRYVGQGGMILNNF